MCSAMPCRTYAASFEPALAETTMGLHPCMRRRLDPFSLTAVHELISKDWLEKFEKWQQDPGDSFRFTGKNAGTWLPSSPKEKVMPLPLRTPAPELEPVAAPTTRGARGAPLSIRLPSPKEAGASPTGKEFPRQFPAAGPRTPTTQSTPTLLGRARVSCGKSRTSSNGPLQTTASNFFRQSSSPSFRQCGADDIMTSSRSGTWY